MNPRSRKAAVGHYALVWGVIWCIVSGSNSIHPSHVPIAQALFYIGVSTVLSSCAKVFVQSVCCEAYELVRALHDSGKLGAGIGDTNGLGLRVLIWGCEASGGSRWSSAEGGAQDPQPYLKAHGT